MPDSYRPLAFRSMIPSQPKSTKKWCILFMCSSSNTLKYSRTVTGWPGIARTEPRSSSWSRRATNGSSVTMSKITKPMFSRRYAMLVAAMNSAARAERTSSSPSSRQDLASHSIAYSAASTRLTADAISSSSQPLRYSSPSKISPTSMISNRASSM
ncbi:hypothetical protein D3C79_858810 [compost metagenome]